MSGLRVRRATVFGLPVRFGPIHVAFIEMVIAPICSLVF